MRVVEAQEGVENPSLDAWTEIIGKVESITKDSITLTQRRLISIKISSNAIQNWRKILRKGKVVGVLMLDDRTFRIRLVRNQAPQNSARKMKRGT